MHTDFLPTRKIPVSQFYAWNSRRAFPLEISLSHRGCTIRDRVSGTAFLASTDDDGFIRGATLLGDTRDHLVHALLSEMTDCEWVNEYSEQWPLYRCWTEAEREALAYLMLTIHDSGVWIWQIFFTIHLLILGRLILASGQYPKLLAYGLMLGGLGYVLDSVYAFAFPDLALLGQVRVALLVIVTISEVGFALWLLLRGPMRPAPV